MVYSPHILQVKKVYPPANDEFGRVVGGKKECWHTLCMCRCDDNTTTEFTTDNGRVFRPKYHIVCDGGVDVNEGDELRCLRTDDSVRGQGTVYLTKRTNFYNYTEIWM